jgi:hypothetical protein
MKNRYFPFLCVLLSAALLLSGYAWGGTTDTTATKAQVYKAKKCLFPKSKKRAPVWVCNAPVAGLAVTGVGAAAKSRAGFAHMKQMAAAEARVQLARNLRGSEQQNIAGSAGSASKDTAERDRAWITRITNESLSNTKILKSAYGPNGTLYVLVGLDASSAQKLRETIAADSQ